MEKVGKTEQDSEEMAVIGLALFTSDAPTQKSLIECFSEVSDAVGSNEGDEISQRIHAVSVEETKVFGSFDLPFCVNVALSIPIGIGTSVAASWLTERLTKSRSAKAKASIRVQVEGFTVNIPAEATASFEPILKALTLATGRTTTRKRQTPRRTKGR
jgi:hypothetical protein